MFLFATGSKTSCQRRCSFSRAFVLVYIYNCTIYLGITENDAITGIYEYRYTTLHDEYCRRPSHSSIKPSKLEIIPWTLGPRKGQVECYHGEGHGTRLMLKYLQIYAGLLSSQYVTHCDEHNGR